MLNMNPDGVFHAPTPFVLPSLPLTNDAKSFVEHLNRYRELFELGCDKILESKQAKLGDISDETSHGIFRTSPLIFSQTLKNPNMGVNLLNSNISNNAPNASDDSKSGNIHSASSLSSHCRRLDPQAKSQLGRYGIDVLTALILPDIPLNMDEVDRRINQGFANISSRLMPSFTNLTHYRQIAEKGKKKSQNFPVEKIYSAMKDLNSKANINVTIYLVLITEHVISSFLQVAICYEEKSMVQHIIRASTIDKLFSIYKDKVQHSKSIAIANMFKNESAFYPEDYDRLVNELMVFLANSLEQINVILRIFHEPVQMLSYSSNPFVCTNPNNHSKACACNFNFGFGVPDAQMSEATTSPVPGNSDMHCQQIPHVPFTTNMNHLLVLFNLLSELYNHLRYLLDNLENEDSFVHSNSSSNGELNVENKRNVGTILLDLAEGNSLHLFSCFSATLLHRQNEEENILPHNFSTSETKSSLITEPGQSDSNFECFSSDESYFASDLTSLSPAMVFSLGLLSRNILHSVISHETNNICPDTYSVSHPNVQCSGKNNNSCNSTSANTTVKSTEISNAFSSSGNISSNSGATQFSTLNSSNSSGCQSGANVSQPLSSSVNNSNVSGPVSCSSNSLNNNSYNFTLTDNSNQNITQYCCTSNQDNIPWIYNQIHAFFCSDCMRWDNLFCKTDEQDSNFHDCMKKKRFEKMDLLQSLNKVPLSQLHQSLCCNYLVNAFKYLLPRLLLLPLFHFFCLYDIIENLHQKSHDVDDKSRLEEVLSILRPTKRELKNDLTKHSWIGMYLSRLVATKHLSCGNENRRPFLSTLLLLSDDEEVNYKLPSSVFMAAARETGMICPNATKVDHSTCSMMPNAPSFLITGLGPTASSMINLATSGTTASSVACNASFISCPMAALSRKIDEIERLLGGKDKLITSPDDLQNIGEFILEGRMQVKENSKRSWSERIVYLFSRILLICKWQQVRRSALSSQFTGCLRIKHRVPLHGGFHVIDVPSKMETNRFQTQLVAHQKQNQIFQEMRNAETSANLSVSHSPTVQHCSSSVPINVVNNNTTSTLEDSNVFTLQNSEGSSRNISFASQSLLNCGSLFPSSSTITTLPNNSINQINDSTGVNLSNQFRLEVYQCNTLSPAAAQTSFDYIAQQVQNNSMNQCCSTGAPSLNNVNLTSVSQNVTLGSSPGSSEAFCDSHNTSHTFIPSGTHLATFIFSVSTFEEKCDWMSCLLSLQNNGLFTNYIRALPKIEIPMKLPSKEKYRFARPDSPESIVFENSHPLSSNTIIPPLFHQNTSSTVNPPELSTNISMVASIRGSQQQVNALNASSTLRLSGRKNKSSPATMPVSENVDKSSVPEPIKVEKETVSFQVDEVEKKPHDFYFHWINYSQPPKILYGVLDKIVERITYPTYTDTYTLNILLMSFRRFTTADDLLDLLIERFCIPDPELSQQEVLDYSDTNKLNEMNAESFDGVNSLNTSSNTTKASSMLKLFRDCYKKKVQAKVLAVLYKWVDCARYYQTDFAGNVVLREKLLNFLLTVQSRDLRVAARDLHQMVANSTFNLPRLNYSLTSDELNIHSNAPHSPICSLPDFTTKNRMCPKKPNELDEQAETDTKFFQDWDNLGSSEIKLSNIHPMDLARQLTLYEWQLYSKIEYWEVDGRDRSASSVPNNPSNDGKTVKNVDISNIAVDVSSNQKIPPGNPVIKNSAHDTPNLRHSKDFSNRFRNWLVYSILRERNTEDRVIMLQRVIDLMLILEKLNNEQGFQEAKSALISASVYRLKKAYQAVKRLKNYREAVEAIRSSESSSSGSSMASGGMTSGKSRNSNSLSTSIGLSTTSPGSSFSQIELNSSSTFNTGSVGQIPGAIPVVDNSYTNLSIPPSSHTSTVKNLRHTSFDRFIKMLESHQNLMSSNSCSLSSSSNSSLRSPQQSVLANMSFSTSGCSSAFFDLHSNNIVNMSAPVKPCVPFIAKGVTTKLIHLELRQPDHITNSRGNLLINFVKHRCLTEIVERYLAYQAVQYDFTHIARIQNFLRTLDPFKMSNCSNQEEFERTMYQLSELYEPRENSSCNSSNLSSTSQCTNTAPCNDTSVNSVQNSSTMSFGTESKLLSSEVIAEQERSLSREELQAAHVLSGLTLKEKMSLQSVVAFNATVHNHFCTVPTSYQGFPINTSSSTIVSSTSTFSNINNNSDTTLSRGANNTCKLNTSCGSGIVCPGNNRAGDLLTVCRPSNGSNNFILGRKSPNSLSPPPSIKVSLHNQTKNLQSSTLNATESDAMNKHRVNLLWHFRLQQRRQQQPLTNASNCIPAIPPYSKDVGANGISLDNFASSKSSNVTSYTTTTAKDGVVSPVSPTGFGHPTLPHQCSNCLATIMQTGHRKSRTSTSSNTIFMDEFSHKHSISDSVILNSSFKDRPQCSNVLPPIHKPFSVLNDTLESPNRLETASPTEYKPIPPPLPPRGNIPKLDFDIKSNNFDAARKDIVIPPPLPPKSPALSNFTCLSEIDEDEKTKHLYSTDIQSDSNNAPPLPPRMF